MPDRETMNISVSPEMKAFVKGLTASGRYRNDSEVVRAGLRLLQEDERQRRLEELLLEGLESGEPVEYTEEHWEALRERALERARKNTPRRRGA